MAAYALLIAAQALRIPATMEHPEACSWNDKVRSNWRTPHSQYLIQKQGVDDVVVVQCVLGSAA